MLCVPSARHVFGTASLASSALSASAELLVGCYCVTHFVCQFQSRLRISVLGYALFEVLADSVFYWELIFNRYNITFQMTSNDVDFLFISRKLARITCIT